MEIESLRLEFHVLYLFLCSLFSFPIFLLFLVRVVPKPRMPFFSLFFNKTNKSHSFSIFLSSSSSPTLLSQISKAPKNPRTKSKIKTDRTGNSNPKIKKIHSNHRLGRMAWVNELGPRAALGEVVANQFGYVVEEVAKS